VDPGNQVGNDCEKTWRWRDHQFDNEHLSSVSDDEPSQKQVLLMTILAAPNTTSPVLLVVGNFDHQATNFLRFENTSQRGQNRRPRQTSRVPFQDLSIEME
jgi:hypothetical protein